jgi:hypothetical protein
MVPRPAAASVSTSFASRPLDPDEVRRRLGAGVPLDQLPTVACWLATDMATDEQAHAVVALFALVLARTWNG